MAATERETVREDLTEASRELANQPRIRKALIEAFHAVALRNALDESKHARSVDELRQWTEVSSFLLRLLRHSRADVLRSLLETVHEVAESKDGDESDEMALDDWGRLQVLATYAELRDESYTVAWLQEHGRSRQQLNQWRQRGLLFGITGLPGVKGYAYPRWEFSETLRPKEWVPRVLEAAEVARLDPLGLHMFMTNPEAGDNRSPLQAAEDGDIDTAVKLVTAANAQGR